MIKSKAATFIASMLISGMLKRRFAQYSEIPLPMTGAEVADYAVAKGVTFVNHTFTSHLALSASMQASITASSSPLMT